MLLKILYSFCFLIKFEHRKLLITARTVICGVTLLDVE